MNELSFFNNLINDKILEVHTHYLGRVEAINGSTATLQPLTEYKARGGEGKQQSLTSAIIPPNIKYKSKTITYMKSSTSSETMAVLVPDSLAVGDIVMVGICDRDITYAKTGKIGTATQRHHDINDGVILQFVR